LRHVATGLQAMVRFLPMLVPDDPATLAAA